MTGKIRTGIGGLDRALHGGIPEHSTVLVCGTPGTGKSILCSQILYHNALNGKKCLFLNLEQDNGKLERQMRQFGWELPRVTRNMKVVSVDSTDPNSMNYLLDEIQGTEYDLIALDSLDSIYSTPTEMDISGKSSSRAKMFVAPVAFDAPTIGRIKLKKIFKAIENSKATTFLTSEKVENAPGLSRDTISEFLCDTIILLTYSGLATGSNRTLEIRKNRIGDFDEAITPMRLTSKGVVVTPLEEEKL